MNVFVTHISGERLWDVDKNLPPQVQIAVNINLLGLEEKSDSSVEAPFVFTVNFSPSIAQINIKGRAKVQGEKEETQRLLEEHKQQKPPPIQIIQAVSGAALAEAILISKSLGVPPPLPPIPGPQDALQQPKTDTRYTI